MTQAKLPEYGQSLTVTDVKERLIQEAHPATLLLWPPNLFAFTSYVLHLSGAYQLVVSPPPGSKALNHWPPTVPLLEKILGRLESIARNARGGRRESLLTLAETCRNQLRFAEKRRGDFETKDKYTVWTFLVRWAALDWRRTFDRMDAAACTAYLGRLPVFSKATAPVPPALEDEISKFPPLLRACWEVFASLYVLGQHRDDAPTVATLLCNDPERADVSAWHAATCLLTMHAIADDATVGWGIIKGRSMAIDFPRLADVDRLEAADRAGEWDAAYATYPGREGHERLGDADVLQVAASRLERERTLGTMEPARARILPKRHNPDVGITLRSLSSNLAFHHSPIEVRWERDSDSDLAARLNADLADGSVESTFTMLLLPWPMHVHSKDFRIIDGKEATEALDNREGYGFFRYQPEEKKELLEEIESVIDAAREEEPVVDMIVLPESALRVRDCEELQRYLTRDWKRRNGRKPVSAFIAGVSEFAAKRGRFKCNNMVRYGYWAGSKFRIGSQYKHHRWQLNKSQIEQYGLSQRLTPKNKWWEAINIERRHVSFINIGDGLTVCPLICEDLARQDPIADLIRQVGPSLVVTILMDGPQHKDRWSSRYASILAEDPGSAVLALTSIGMVRRWSTRFGRMSRVVALWNDKDGAREIELEAGASGILLTLKLHSEPEVIADGRLEMCPTAKIYLTDVNQIYMPAAQLRHVEPAGVAATH